MTQTHHSPVSPVSLEVCQTLLTSILISSTHPYRGYVKATHGFDKSIGRIKMCEISMQAPSARFVLTLEETQASLGHGTPKKVPSKLEKALEDLLFHLFEVTDLVNVTPHAIEIPTQKKWRIEVTSKTEAKRMVFTIQQHKSKQNKSYLRAQQGARYSRSRPRGKWRYGNKTTQEKQSSRS